MDQIQVIDNQKFIQNKLYSKVMNNDEKLYWSGLSNKINKVGKRQERFFILTDQRFVNVGK